MAEWLGQWEKYLLNFFEDEVEGGKVATIKQLAKYLYCTEEPTKTNIREVHRIVDSLEKKGKVETKFINPGKRRIDFKYQPPNYKIVWKKGYKGDLIPDKKD